jgi:hypothetical protein
MIRAAGSRTNTLQLLYGLGAAAASVLLGAALAVWTVPPVLVAGLVVAAIAVPIAVIALSHVSGVTPAGGIVLLGLGVADAIVVHHVPNISLLEILLLGPAVLLVLARLPVFRMEIAGRGFVRLFLVSSLAIIALGALYVLIPSAGLGRAAPLKELGKNAEIFVFAAATFVYVDGKDRFARFYGLLLASAVAGTFSPIITTHGHLFAKNSLNNPYAIYVIVLALPFARRRSVAALLLATVVMLIVARTRGPWIELLIVGLIVLASRGFRTLLSPLAVRMLTAAAVCLVLSVALIPSLNARVGSIAAGNDQSVHDRTAMTHAALIEMEKYPLTGVGPGEFKPWLLKSPPVVSFQLGVQNIPSDPHDTFAKFAGEMGVPGLVLLCLWIAAVLGPMWRFRRELPAVPGFGPYAVGTSLYAILFFLTRLTSEWATLGRLSIGLGAGLLLAITRIVDADRRSTVAETG